MAHRGTRSDHTRDKIKTFTGRLEPSFTGEGTETVYCAVGTTCGLELFPAVDVSGHEVIRGDWQRSGKVEKAGSRRIWLGSKDRFRWDGPSSADDGQLQKLDREC